MLYTCEERAKDKAKLALIRWLPGVASRGVNQCPSAYPVPIVASWCLRGGVLVPCHALCDGTAQGDMEEAPKKDSDSNAMDCTIRED